MGEVYRARDSRLGRDVALKVLPPAWPRTPNAWRVSNTRRALWPASTIPNIVTLYSVEDEDGIRFLTMELVEGQGLDRQVTPGGLPIARVVELGSPSRMRSRQRMRRAWSIAI